MAVSVNWVPSCNGLTISALPFVVYHSAVAVRGHGWKTTGKHAKSRRGAKKHEKSKTRKVKKVPEKTPEKSEKCGEKVKSKSPKKVQKPQTLKTLTGPNGPKTGPHSLQWGFRASGIS